MEPQNILPSDPTESTNKALYEAGKRFLLGKEKNYQEAIWRFEELLQRSPNYQDAEKLLQQAKNQLVKGSSSTSKQKNLLWVAGILVIFLILLGATAVGNGWFPPPIEITPTSTGMIIGGVTPDTPTPVPPTSKPDTPTFTPSPTDESTQEPTQEPTPTSELTQEAPSPTSEPTDGSTPIPPPEPPTNFQVSDTTETSLTLSWINPANNYTQIILQSDDIVIPELPTDSQTYMVEGLACGKSYNFTIIAINEVGQSEPMSLSAQTGNCPAPPPPPPPAITPTGKIAVPVFEAGTYNIYLASAANNWIPKLLFDRASQPAFLQDGKGMVLRSWKHQDWAQSLILLSDYTNLTAPHTLTNLIEGAYPVLNMSRQEVVFHAQQPKRPPMLFKVGLHPNAEIKDLGEGQNPSWMGDQIIFYFAGGLYLMDAGGNNRNLLLTTEQEVLPAIAPDNNRVVFAMENGPWQVYSFVVSEGEKSLTQLTQEPAADNYLPTWSPDGKLIAFVSNRGGNWAVWVINPDGSEPRQLFDLPGSVDGIVTVDGIETRTTFGWWDERLSWAP